MPIISETFPPYDHANVAVAIDAYLDADDRSYELIGLSGQQRHSGSLSDLIEMGEQTGAGLGSVDHVNLAVGPEETMAAVQFGIYLIQDAGVPLVLLLRGAQEHHGPDAGVTVELLSAQQDPARSLCGGAPAPADCDRRQREHGPRRAAQRGRGAHPGVDRRQPCRILSRCVAVSAT